jgi:uncharacterized protein (TIGR03067 family)
MLRRHFLALLGTLSLAGLGLAPAAEDEPTGDLKDLQGGWTVVLPDGTTATFKFENNKVHTVLGDTTIDSEATLDEKAMPHKSIDLRIEAGPPDIVGLTSLGIYKFSEDKKKFTLCVGHPGQARPEEFEEVEGAVVLFELDRDTP